MSKTRILLGIAAIVMVAGGTVFGQTGYDRRSDRGPDPYPYPGRYPGENYADDLAKFHPGEFNPFVDHDRFESDYQFFAPVDDEVDYFSGIDKPNTGWFFDYRRLYWNVSRPSNAPINTGGDFTWGNQINLGYWTEKDHGWLIEYVHVDGPTTTGNNDANFTSIELSKTYRTDIFRKPGDSFEVFFGGRFVDFTDRSQLVFGPGNALFDVPTNNKILQGVIGTKFSRRHGHWLISAETRIAPGANAMGTANIAAGSTSSSGAFAFTYSADARAMASYQVTRDFALSIGAEYQLFARGISRNGAIQDRKLGMGGAMVGFTFNR